MGARKNRAILPCVIAFLLISATALAVTAADRPTITPAPRLGEWLEGTGSATPFTVERWGKALSREGKALVTRYSGRLPKGKLPAEGYLLSVGPKGAVAVAADDAGALRARQTLRQLPPEPGASPALCIADWPDMGVRGIHVLDSGPWALPGIKRLIHEVLGGEKCNLLVYEIDYNFAFKSHPELAGGGAWTASQVGEIVAACAEEGIRVIPEINCLGHQSWQEPPGTLLRAHPEFEEIPDGRIPQTRTGSGQFYCRSWCPRHPQVHPMIYDLIDELVDAFKADSFHAGMDEVFVIASDKCPRCAGADPAEVFAQAVKDLHGHLKGRGKGMLMWGDRLLDGRKLGYSDWDASGNGTAPAIDRIPKDIIICDWHYDWRESYPSLRVFPDKGFRMLPTTYSSLEGTMKFMADAKARKSPKVLGVLTSIWIPVNDMYESLLGDGRRGDVGRISRTAVAGLERAWAGTANDGPVITPEKPTFMDQVTVKIKAARPGAVIRYTLDGSPVSPDSPKYTGPIRLARSAAIRAALSSGKAVAMRESRAAFEKLEPREPDPPASAEPGLKYSAYLAEGMFRENMPDYSRMKAEKSGTAGFFDLSLAPREDRFGMVFTGWLEVPRDGLYILSVGSDDGSRLYIGDRLVADNDGLHQYGEKGGEAALKAGKHRIRVEFFEGEGGQRLSVKWEGPGVPRQDIPAGVLWREKTEPAR
jgi:hypothetical protein